MCADNEATSRGRHTRLGCVLETRVDRMHADARVTHDLATPVKLTAAVLVTFHAPRRVASLTAQQSTAAYTERLGVAHAAPGAERTLLSVRDAVVRRHARVHYIGETDRLYSPSADRHQRHAVVRDRHLRCAVEAGLEARPDVVEMRHLLPTRLECARPGEAVALTHHAHVFDDGLQREGVRASRGWIFTTPHRNQKSIK